MKKRILAVFLTFFMLIGLMPTAALAAESEPTFSITLDTSGLINATATLSKSTGIVSATAVTLTLAPSFKDTVFNSPPTCEVAEGGQFEWGAEDEAPRQDGKSHIFTIYVYSDLTIKVSGVASANDSSTSYDPGSEGSWGPLGLPLGEEPSDFTVVYHPNGGDETDASKAENERLEKRVRGEYKLADCLFDPPSSSTTINTYDGYDSSIDIGGSMREGSVTWVGSPSLGASDLKFFGWTTTAYASVALAREAGATVYQPGDSFNVDADVDLYALWGDPDVELTPKDGHFVIKLSEDYDRTSGVVAWLPTGIKGVQIGSDDAQTLVERTDQSTPALTIVRATNALAISTDALASMVKNADGDDILIESEDKLAGSGLTYQEVNDASGAHLLYFAETSTEYKSEVGDLSVELPLDELIAYPFSLLELVKLIEYVETKADETYQAAGHAEDGSAEEARLYLEEEKLIATLSALNSLLDAKKDESSKITGERLYKLFAENFPNNVVAAQLGYYGIENSRASGNLVSYGQIMALCTEPAALELLDFIFGSANTPELDEWLAYEYDRIFNAEIGLTFAEAAAVLPDAGIAEADTTMKFSDLYDHIKTYADLVAVYQFATLKRETADADTLEQLKTLFDLLDAVAFERGWMLSGVSFDDVIEMGMKSQITEKLRKQPSISHNAILYYSLNTLKLCEDMLDMSAAEKLHTFLTERIAELEKLIVDLEVERVEEAKLGDEADNDLLADLSAQIEKYNSELYWRTSPAHLDTLAWLESLGASATDSDTTIDYTALAGTLVGYLKADTVAAMKAFVDDYIAMTTALGTATSAISDDDSAAELAANAEKVEAVSEALTGAVDAAYGSAYDLVLAAQADEILKTVASMTEEQLVDLASLMSGSSTDSDDPDGDDAPPAAPAEPLPDARIMIGSISGFDRSGLTYSLTGVANSLSNLIKGTKTELQSPIVLGAVGATASAVDSNGTTRPLDFTGSVQIAASSTKSVDLTGRLAGSSGVSGLANFDFSGIGSYMLSGTTNAEFAAALLAALGYDSSVPADVGVKLTTLVFGALHGSETTGGWLTGGATDETPVSDGEPLPDADDADFTDTDSIDYTGTVEVLGTLGVIDGSETTDAAEKLTPNEHATALAAYVVGTGVTDALSAAADAKGVLSREQVPYMVFDAIVNSLTGGKNALPDYTSGSTQGYYIDVAKGGLAKHATYAIAGDNGSTSAAPESGWENGTVNWGASFGIISNDKPTLGAHSAASRAEIFARLMNSTDGFDSDDLKSLLVSGSSEFEEDQVQIYGKTYTLFYTDHFSDYIIMFEPGSPFGDLNGSEWYYEDALLAFRALLIGTVDGDFEGERELTAAEMAEIFCLETPSDPTASVARQTFVTALYEHVSALGGDVSIGEETNILSYVDALELDETAFAAMQWACGAGVVIRKSDGVLDPNGAITRAEAAAMLRRALA